MPLSLCRPRRVVCQRTLKYMVALLRGRWLLAEEWVQGERRRAACLAPSVQGLRS